jgi:hypothetical protein
MKINAGFRCEEALYEDVKAIAEAEKRSISNVFDVMVAAGVRLYKEKNWAALAQGDEDEQS